MADNLSPDEQTIINETLRRLRANDRHPIASHKVKQFLRIVGDELKRTGELKKEYVDRVVQQLKAGEG
jgi:hypothetical protein